MDYETDQDLFDALSAPFPAEYIEWRVGQTNEKWRKEGEPVRGKPLCYIDARAVMDRLDTVCGPGHWQCNYTPANGMLLCNLGVHFPGGGWTWKADGAGSTDFEAEKGMASDAFKRAAVRFGIGRYLYDIAVKSVDLIPAGKSWKFSDETIKTLDSLHDEHAKKVGWGGPSDVATYRVLLKIVQDTVTQASDVAAFREKYKGMLPMLRVAARRHLDGVLDRIGEPAQQAAE